MWKETRRRICINQREKELPTQCSISNIAVRVQNHSVLWPTVRLERLMRQVDHGHLQARSGKQHATSLLWKAARYATPQESSTLPHSSGKQHTTSLLRKAACYLTPKESSTLPHSSGKQHTTSFLRKAAHYLTPQESSTLRHSSGKQHATPLLRKAARYLTPQVSSTLPHSSLNLFPLTLLPSKLLWPRILLTQFHNTNIAKPT